MPLQLSRSNACFRNANSIVQIHISNSFLLLLVRPGAPSSVLAPLSFLFMGTARHCLLFRRLSPPPRPSHSVRAPHAPPKSVLPREVATPGEGLRWLGGKHQVSHDGFRKHHVTFCIGDWWKSLSRLVMCSVNQCPPPRSRKGHQVTVWDQVPKPDRPCDWIVKYANRTTKWKQTTNAICIS